jgi:hypothetical protein
MQEGSCKVDDLIDVLALVPSRWRCCLCVYIYDGSWNRTRETNSPQFGKIVAKEPEASVIFGTVWSGKMLFVCVYIYDGSWNRTRETNSPQFGKFVAKEPEASVIFGTVWSGKKFSGFVDKDEQASNHS